MKKNPFSSTTAFTFAIVLGIFCGYLNQPVISSTAGIVSQIFINLLKLVSLPIIFLSIVSTAAGMENIYEIRSLGTKVIKYTLLTTVLAATVALGLFVAIDPVRAQFHTADPILQEQGQAGYLTYLIKAIPSNIITPFSENNVISVLIMAMLFSAAILALPAENRKVLHAFFSSVYAAIMKITGWIVKIMPIAIWSFIILTIKDFQEGLEASSIAFYLAVVVCANLVQAFIVLPIFLKWKKISPIEMAKGMFPALSLAFFTKSSSATLPMAMKCAQENVGISPKIASFTLPLCTSINMNGCAAFILSTVLFVSMSQGITYSPAEMIGWIFIATIAAVGNAGVPMGCYFLSSAFLASMNVPLNLLGVILPFYAIIDMIETAINVWSDSCVAAVVNKEAIQSAPEGVQSVALT